DVAGRRHVLGGLEQRRFPARMVVAGEALGAGIAIQRLPLEDPLLAFGAAGERPVAAGNSVSIRNERRELLRTLGEAGRLSSAAILLIGVERSAFGIAQAA